jgi:N-acetylglucosamine kinase-like BadF-type ATPase
MILVADSGSTKCDWIPISLGELLEKQSTVGFNPYFCDERFIMEGILSNSFLSDNRKNVKRVFFFGAGCSSDDRNALVSNALLKVFPSAEVLVDHDVYGSALATCGNDPGIACILGTGSNSCYFDGKNVHTNNYGLGYIMGDEGSGSYFGKKLITRYLYGILPDPIKTAFESRYVMDKEVMIEHVYSKPGANVWLASFAKFLSEFPNDAWVKDTVKKGFEEFFDLYVCGYPDYKSLPVHFVGSIAYHFEPILREVGASRSANVVKVIRRPVIGLAEFYAKKYFPSSGKS